jgi:hypothetical protein
VRGFAYQAPKRRTLTFRYTVPAPGQKCGTGTQEQVVGRDTICTSVADSDSSKVFNRMPPYGRWSVSVLGGWPSALETPEFAVLHLTVATTPCERAHDLRTDIEFAEQAQPLDGLGFVCGGNELGSRAAVLPNYAQAPPATARPTTQPPTLLPTTQQPTPPLETSQTSAVVAAVSALAAAACLIALAIVMTRKRNGSSELTKSLADTAGPAQQQ